jgi:hypothetical protein
MSERLTDEQLREWLDHYPEHPYAGQWSGQALIIELLAARARVAKLEAALERADGVIQKTAMALGSTDEWTEQETMIADFEARIAALKDAPQ